MSETFCRMCGATLREPFLDHLASGGCSGARLKALELVAKAAREHIARVSMEIAGTTDRLEKTERTLARMLRRVERTEGAG